MGEISLAAPYVTRFAVREEFITRYHRRNLRDRILQAEVINVRFEILAGDVVIGWSELESGDPPMGVALGRVHVTSAYGTAPAATVLRVRPEGEPFFEPSGGVYIADLREQLGDDAIEVSS